MMRLIAFIALAFFVALVAACGVDGEPEKPQDKTADAAVSVSGRAEFGLIF